MDSYVERANKNLDKLAEREGFEPSRQFNAAYSISSRALSTTQTSLRLNLLSKKILKKHFQKYLFPDKLTT